MVRMRRENEECGNYLQNVFATFYIRVLQQTVSAKRQTTRISGLDHDIIQLKIGKKGSNSVDREKRKNENLAKVIDTPGAV